MCFGAIGIAKGVGIFCDDFGALNVRSDWTRFRNLSKGVDFLAIEAEEVEEELEEGLDDTALCTDGALVLTCFCNCCKREAGWMFLEEGNREELAIGLFERGETSLSTFVSVFCCFSFSVCFNALLRMCFSLSSSTPTFLVVFLCRN